MLKALDKVLQEPNLPDAIVKNVLQQIAKVLPNDATGRHDFVTSGGFAVVQQLDANSGSKLKECTNAGLSNAAQALTAPRIPSPRPCG